MNNQLMILAAVIVILITFFIFNGKKEQFYNIEEELRAEQDLYYRQQVYTNEVVPAKRNNDLLTKTDFQDMFTQLLQSISENGPPGGQNTNVGQEKYDLIFKDILVNSCKRNHTKFPNPNTYSVLMNLNIDRIYKAELIEVYIPAATDPAVNITPDFNRLYFSYTSGSTSTVGYITIEAGTYFNPEAVASELNRQFGLVLTAAGFDLTKSNVGVGVNYNQNLNRYFFYDLNNTVSGTLIIYPTNGYVINMDITVQNSIAPALKLIYEGPAIYSPYVSGPTTISSDSYGNLYVDIASNYGEFTDSGGNVQPVPTDSDPFLSNSVVSGVVLTIDKIYLSLGKLNGNTCNIIGSQNSNTASNVSNVFCQVPNNTTVSSASVKTLLDQPPSYSCIQFYNPLLSKLNSLDIQWISEKGTLVDILDHSFTLRVHYFQKRLVGTDFSYQIP